MSFIEAWGLRGVGLGLVVFTLLSVIAVSANFIVHNIDPASPMFLFYLHPDCPVTFPILDSAIKPHVEFFLYYVIFLLCFYVLALLPWGIATLSSFLYSKTRHNKTA